MLTIDPPPFFWLQGLVSFNAFIVSSTVLVRQNRLGRLAERHAHLDLQVNLLTEKKSSKIIDLLEQLKASLHEIRAEAREAENKLSYLQLQAKRQRDLSGRGVTTAAKLEQTNSEEQEGQEARGEGETDQAANVWDPLQRRDDDRRGDRVESKVLPFGGGVRHENFEHQRLDFAPPCALFNLSKRFLGETLGTSAI